MHCALCECTKCTIPEPTYVATSLASPESCDVTVTFSKFWESCQTPLTKLLIIALGGALKPKIVMKIAKSALSSLLNDEIKQRGADGIEKFIRDHGLDAENPIRRLIPGENGINEGTIADYCRRWAELKQFFILIGDYQSACLCDRVNCPSNPYPIKPESLCMYFSWKFGEKDELLTTYGSTDVQLDILGRAIMCENTWNAPTNLNKARAAVMALHNMYPGILDGKFQNACDKCQNANGGKGQLQPGQFGVWQSCMTHAGHPLIRPIGNVVTSPIVENHISYLKDEHADYEKKGATQLLPGEIRTLRNYLIGSGDLFNIQIYVMILLGIKLFLRADELLSLKLEDIVPRHCIIDGDTKCVSALCFRIKGKTDVSAAELMLFADDEYPEFCPVRHLLVYLHLLNFKGGYLFPTEKEYTTSSSKTFAGHMEYSSWLSIMKNLMTKVLHRDEKTQSVSVGTHTLRKTGYLFAIWGVISKQTNHDVAQLNLADIMKGARHKSLNNAQTYSKDCGTLWECVLREKKESLHAVSKWRPIHVEQTASMNAIITDSVRWQKPIDQLSAWYVRDILGIQVEAGGITPQFMMNCALRNTAGKSPLEKLRELFGKLADNDRDEATALLSQILRQQQYGGGHCVQETSTKRSQQTAFETTLYGKSNGNKRPRIEKDDNNTEREAIKKEKRGKEKLLLLLSYNGKVGNSLSSYSKKDKDFYNRNVKSLSKCWADCHRGDHDAMVATWAKVTNNTFKTTNWACGEGCLGSL